MAQHPHKHTNAHRNAKTAEVEPGGKKLHKDWRVWLAVIMMLAAMLTYVLTLDDSIVPAIMRQ